MSQTHIKTFDDWAQLAVDQGIKDGSVANVILNNEVLTFKYDSSSAAVINSTADGPGTVADGQGSVGRWILQYKGPIKPEWWGATSTATGAVNTAAFSVSKYHWYNNDNFF